MNRCSLRSRHAAVLALTIVALVSAIAMAAAGENPIPGIARAGVRHQIYVSIAFDPASPLREPQARATLSVPVRISDHAPDANFYGTLAATFADVAVTETPPAQLLWEDKACHIERGLPRFAVLGLNGMLSRPQGESVISARPRHLGQTLPQDELFEQQAYVLGHDPTGEFLAQRMVTRSGVKIEVKLYTLKCLISAP